MESGGVGRLRVNSDAGDLREPLLDAVFQRGGDIVDASNGEVAFHHAVTGNENVVLHLADPDVVAVDELVVGAGHAVEEGFDGHFELPHLAGAGIGRGDVAAERLDVNVDVNVVFAEFADAVFEFGGAAVGFAKAEVFVDFEMKFDKQVAVLLGRGDVVNSQAKTQRDGADGFEQVLIARGARFGVDDNVRGNNLRDALFDFVGEGVDLLEIGGAGDADGGIDKIAVAGAAQAHTFNAENAVNISDLRNELFLQPRGGGVEKGIQRSAAELRTDPEDHTGDSKARERVGVSQLGNVPDVACPDQPDAEDDDNRAPYISREMQCVGFEGFARVALGDDIERAGPGHINREGHEQDQDGSDARLNMDGMEKKAMEGFVDDVNRREDEQAGFDKCGEILKLAVAVGVALVSRPVGDADREKRDDGGDQVEARVQRLRKDTEAVGTNDQKCFQAKQETGGANAQQCGALLFVDGSLEASGKDHGVRLQQVARGCRTWGLLLRRQS
jgi:hypothetical protein